MLVNITILADEKIDHDTKLSPTEKKSLRAYVNWRLNSPANMTGLKARLDKLDEKALADVDNRTDGKVEIINVTINNRKTKRSDGKTGVKKSDLHDVKISHSDKNNNSKKLEAELSKKSSFRRIR